jgi:hypothetical protein
MMGSKAVLDLRRKYSEALHGVDDEDKFEEENDILTLFVEIARLEARLRLAGYLSHGLVSFRRVAGSSGMRDSYTGRAVIEAHDAWLAGKED